MNEVSLELGKKYKQVVYVPGKYDIVYLNNVEVYKITKKSYMLMDCTTGKTYRVRMGAILEAK